MYKSAVGIYSSLPRFTAALLLLLLFAMLQFSSSGIIRGGDEDNGSGIGGTGRSLPSSGESGIGGTGLKPFLGKSDNYEIEILHDPALREDAIARSVEFTPAVTDVQPKVATAIVVSRDSEKTMDSSPIEIGEAIQSAIVSEIHILEEIQAELAAQEFPSGLQANESDLDSTAEIVDTVAPKQITWDAVAALLRAGPTENTGSNREGSGEMTNVSLSQEDLARLARPERIQRPELPPIQRVSPLQRTAILPPRVQPMRL